MNCREFIKEFEERGVLSSVAQTHLNDCPGCRKTTVVQTHIWQAIDALPQVNAPSNFDFRVKARIANGKPAAEIQPKFLPVLRYVLPFSAIVLVLGLLAFNTNIFFGSDAAQEVAILTPPTAVAAETPPVNPPSPAMPTVSSNVSPSFTDERFVVMTANQNTRLSSERPKPRFVVDNSVRKLPLAPRRAEVKDNSEEGAGYLDRTVSLPSRVLMPEGFASNPTAANTNSVNSPVARSADIWSFVGVEIISQNGVQTIREVKPDSIAGRAGLRAGDVIEAVNGAKFSAQTSSAAVSELKTLTVLRGTERLEIKIGN